MRPLSPRTHPKRCRVFIAGRGDLELVDRFQQGQQVPGLAGVALPALSGSVPTSGPEESASQGETGMVTADRRSRAKHAVTLSYQSPISNFPGPKRPVFEFVAALPAAMVAIPRTDGNHPHKTGQKRPPSF